MKPEEAIGICERWFAHLEQQRQKSIEIQKLVALARKGHQAEAQRRLRQIDRDPVVYDGARLEPAVRFLVDEAKRQGKTSCK